MSVLAVVQARLSSERFPRKVLADIYGKPLIRHVVERVNAIRSVDTVVVAAPASDCQEIAHAAGPGVCVFGHTGETHDVLGRFAAVVKQWDKHETVMRITADCPLLDPEIAEAVITLFNSTNCHYAWNCDEAGYVDGEDVEVMYRDAILLADERTDDKDDREHVTPWIRRHLKVATLPYPNPERTYLKTSVDTREDLEVVRILMEGECPTG